MRQAYGSLIGSMAAEEDKLKLTPAPASCPRPLHLLGADIVSRSSAVSYSTPESPIS